MDSRSGTSNGLPVTLHNPYDILHLPLQNITLPESPKVAGVPFTVAPSLPVRFSSLRTPSSVAAPFLSQTSCELFALGSTRR